METAENIAKSCNMLTEFMQINYIRSADCADLTAHMKNILLKMKSNISDGYGLLVEGEALA